MEAPFVETAEQVEGFDRDIGSPDAALQETPVALEAVGMNPAPDVSLGVVGDLVNEGVIQAFV